MILSRIPVPAAESGVPAVLSNPTAVATGATTAGGTVDTDTLSGTLYYLVSTDAILPGATEAERAQYIKDNGGSQPVTDSTALLFSIVVENTSGSALTDVPVTLGQTFLRGDIPTTKYLRAYEPGDVEIATLQLDRSVTHTDGSLRHGAISFILPTLAAAESKTIVFYTATGTSPASSLPAVDLTVAAPAPTLTAAVTVAGDGVYTSDAMLNLTDSGTIKHKEGPVVTEYIVKGELLKAGTPHVDLEIYYHVRCYSTGDIRTDFVLENTIAQNTDVNYDVQWLFTNESGSDSRVTDLTHYARARFRRTVWSNGAPDINIRHDALHLIKSKGVASYSRSSPPSESALAAMDSALAASDTNPMGAANIDVNFSSNAEASIDVNFAVAYLLSGDKRAYAAMIANANAAGSFVTHYRDSKAASNLYQSTGQHPSVLEHLTQGIHQDSAIKFPTSTGAERPQLGSVDTAHQDSFAYLAYVLTSDYYLLEEVQFWANWNLLNRNPGYRNEFGAGYYGIINRSQIRSHAWSLVGIANSAFITPDVSPDKSYFMQLTENHLDFYVDKHVNGVHDNSLGYLVKLTVFDTPVIYGGDYPGWDDPLNPGTQMYSGIAPWMENWCAAAFGRLHQMELYDDSRALNLITWKAAFTTGPLTDPGFCRIISTSYTYHVTDNLQAPYSGWSDVYQATLANGDAAYDGYQTDLSDCGSLAMSTAFSIPTAGAFRYSDNDESFYAMHQGGVAAAVNSGAPGAATAWANFKASAVTPDYSVENRYNIIPYSEAIN